MTENEAIEILRDTPIDIRSTREDDIHTLYATAQNMAIEALKRENTTEDFIMKAENISTHNYYPNRETKEMVIPTQEAAKLIKELYYEEDYCLVPELAEALDLAIEALERQTTKRSDEIIANNKWLKEEVARLEKIIDLQTDTMNELIDMKEHYKQEIIKLRTKLKGETDEKNRYSNCSSYTSTNPNKCFWNK